MVSVDVWKKKVLTKRVERRRSNPPTHQTKKKSTAHPLPINMSTLMGRRLSKFHWTITIAMAQVKSSLVIRKRVISRRRRRNKLMKKRKIPKVSILVAS